MSNYLCSLGSIYEDNKMKTIKISDYTIAKEIYDKESVIDRLTNNGGVEKWE